MVSSPVQRQAIVIITARAGFPNGAGATARIRTWAAGFREYGFATWVIPLKASEPPQGPAINHAKCGSVDGVSYLYASGSTRTSSSLVGKVLLWIRSLLVLPLTLLRIHRRTPVSVIHYYTPEHLSYAIVAWLSARCLGAKLVGERTEAGPSSQGALGLLFERYAYKLFDGFVVISSYLHTYMKPRLGPRARILHIPILVDTGRFATCSQSSDKSLRWVAYSGALNRHEEITVLFEVFAQASAGMHDWGLMIIGRLDDTTKKQYTQLADNLGVGSRVEFTGHVSYEDIPRRLGRASVLVLPRASGVFSQAGFPTKLGEYLATGRPTIVTATGDIPEYLVDGQDAFLVEPGDWEAFSRRLRATMQEPDIALEVGKQGRDTAIRHFSHLPNSERYLTTMLGCVARPPRGTSTELQS